MRYRNQLKCNIVNGSKGNKIACNESRPEKNNSWTKNCRKIGSNAKRVDEIINIV